MPARIDDALLLADLRRVARKLKQHTMTQEEYSEHGRYSYSPMAKRFGGWNKALRTAGLQPSREMDVSAEDLLADLKRVAIELGEGSITHLQYEEHGRYSHGPFLTRFGSWNHSVELAGLRIKRHRTVTESSILSDLRRVARLLGKQSMTAEEYEAHGKYHRTTIYRRCRGWNKALVAARLKPSRVMNVPTSKLLGDVRRVARELGEGALRPVEYNAHGKYGKSIFSKRFGAWNTVLRRAGLETFTIRGLPDADVLMELQRVAKELGKRILSRQEYDAHGQYSSGSIARRFDSWPNALERAGLVLSPLARTNVSSKELLEDLRRVARRLGKVTVSTVEYSSIGKHSFSIFYERFGSWPNALERAGLERGEKRMNVPSNELIGDLRRIAKRLGTQTLKREEYDAHGGRYHNSTIGKRFGSWAKALRAAGLESGRERNIAAANLLADLQRVARGLKKRTVTGGEYKTNGGKHALYTFVQRFGSWPKALLAAGLQPTPAQLVHDRCGINTTLRTLAAIPGLTTEDRMEVAKTVDGVRDLSDEVIAQLFRRMNLGPVELPSGIPSGVLFWERCIAALQKVQPDPEKLRATGVLERLGRQLHRAVALELLGREPLSPAEEQRVAQELQRRKAA